MLCEDCQDRSIQNLPDAKEIAFTRHSPRSSQEQQTAAYCAREYPIIEPSAWDSFTWYKSAEPQFTCHVAGDGLASEGIRFAVLKLDRADGRVRYIPTTTSTFSKQACQQVKTWLGDCPTSNPDCRRALNIPKYPTRLVVVGDSASTKIRLCSPAKENLSTPYMTLSHMWGVISMFSPTSANLSSLYEEIPLDELSKVFKDAITVTRMLGIKYLWIDSLSIIQSGLESKQDWVHEAERMGDVYANAYCNIGDSIAKDGSFGLIYPRDPAKVALPTIELGLQMSQSSLGSVGISGTHVIVPVIIWKGTLSGFPLLHRAWVFQERFLCSRMIYFGADQIFWECNNICLCESTPRKDFREGYGANRDKHRMVEVGLLALAQRANWYYAKTQEDISSSGNDLYLADCWLSDLPLVLNWYVIPDNRLEEALYIPSPSRPAEYRAPSWSWAAVNRKIEHLYVERVPQRVLRQATIVDFELELATANKFGAVKYASLTVRGHLQKLKWTMPDTGRNPSDIMPLVGRETRNYRCWYPDEFPLTAHEGEILCLMLCKQSPLSPYGTEDVHGITIEKCANQDV